MQPKELNCPPQKIMGAIALDVELNNLIYNGCVFGTLCLKSAY